MYEHMSLSLQQGVLRWFSVLLQETHCYIPRHIPDSIALHFCEWPYQAGHCALMAMFLHPSLVLQKLQEVCPKEVVVSAVVPEVGQEFISRRRPSRLPSSADCSVAGETLTTHKLEQLTVTCANFQKQGSHSPQN